MGNNWEKEVIRSQTTNQEHVKDDLEILNIPKMGARKKKEKPATKTTTPNQCLQEPPPDGNRRKERQISHHNSRYFDFNWVERRGFPIFGGTRN